MSSKLVLLVFALLASQAAHAQTTVANLCAKGVEGSYLGTLKGKRTLNIRLNLICVSPDHMLSSLAIVSSVDPGADAVLSFSNAAIDEDQLIISVFPIQADSRSEISSKTSGGYARLPLTALLQGKPTGKFYNGHAIKPMTLTATRDQKFPVLKGVSSNIPRSWFVGSFTMSKSVAGPLNLECDILADVPVIAAETAANEVVRLLDGPAWRSDGVFSSASPTGDGEWDTHNVFSIRGRVLSENEMEVYWISPHKGLEGPLKATKQPLLRWFRNFDWR